MRCKVTVGLANGLVLGIFLASLCQFSFVCERNRRALHSSLSTRAGEVCELLWEQFLTTAASVSLPGLSALVICVRHVLLSSVTLKMKLQEKEHRQCDYLQEEMSN